MNTTCLSLRWIGLAIAISAVGLQPACWRSFGEGHLGDCKDGATCEPWQLCVPGEGCLCDPEACAGCCAGADCLAGDDDDACGLGGPCDDCASRGQRCVGASCVDAVCPSDACDLEAGSECDGPTSVRFCEDLDGDGCGEWAGGIDCGEGQVCADGRCRSDCARPCTPGEVHCFGDRHRECEGYDEDCTQWVEFDSCSPDLACDMGSCDGHDSNCENLGDRECHGRGIRECKLIDGSLKWRTVEECSEGEECLDWNEGVECYRCEDCDPETISCNDDFSAVMECVLPPDSSCLQYRVSESCTASSECDPLTLTCTPPCVTDCDETDVDCDEFGRISRCEFDGTCHRMSAFEDCEESFYVCDPDELACVPECPDRCLFPGLPRCSAEGAYEVCTEAPLTGCLGWVVVDECNDSMAPCTVLGCHPVCVSECEETDSCRFGAFIFFCEFDPGSGCHEWLDAEPCDGSGMCDVVEECDFLL